MNTQLLAVVKRIIAEQGEYILSDPRRLKPFIKNYAQHILREERRALGRCIENGAYSVLKTATDPADRAVRKAAFAARLRGPGLDTRRAAEALDILETALYGSAGPYPPGWYVPAVPGGAAAILSPFYRLSALFKKSTKRTQTVIITAAACAAALALIITAALHFAVRIFEPIVEFNGAAYPSKIITTAGINAMLGGDSRMIETETYSGDALGDFGVKLRSGALGSTIRVEIEGAYFVRKSVYETELSTNKTLELFPRINYNYERLKNNKELRTENITFTLYVNDRQKRQETLVVPFHSIDVEPAWTESVRDAKKTLNNYHYVVVLREAEKIERELERIRQAEASRQRDAEAARRRAAEAEAARRSEAERRAARTRDPYNDRRIRDTLVKVHNNLYDVNGDGQTNCIDYSNLFYYFSPFKSTGVVVNVNNSTDMNHQFNSVQIDGQTIFVEPQARPDRSYDLESFWGSRYNPSYNQLHNTTWLFLTPGVPRTEE